MKISDELKKVEYVERLLGTAKKILSEIESLNKYRQSVRFRLEVERNKPYINSFLMIPEADYYMELLRIQSRIRTLNKRYKKIVK